MADSTENKNESENRKNKIKRKGKEIAAATLERASRAKDLLRLSHKKDKEKKSGSDSTDKSQSALMLKHSSTHEMTSARRWFSSFARSDPRWQISRFFDDLAQEGAQNIEASGELVLSPAMDRSSILRPFAKSAVFTVWRPTSFVAIRRMIAGEATGKGLEIKGKSAKTGKLSGFVPYLQIDQEEDKKRVGTLSRGGRTRIFFATKEARDTMVTELKPLQNQMMNTVAQAKLLLRDTAVTGLTPFSAATRMAASGLSRPIGRTLSRASGSAKTGLKPVGRAVCIASGMAATGLNPITRTASKASKVTVSALSPLGQSLSNGAKDSDPNCSTPAAMAKRSLKRASLSGEKRTPTNEKKDQDDDDERESALTRLLFDMDDPSIKLIDKYAPECYGIELPDRLLWKGCVVDRDISRPEDSDYHTGRPSQPAFQDMNFRAIWKTQKTKKGPSKPDAPPLVVLWQTSTSNGPDDDPMDPRGLIMAYEEKGRVLPVVSDFDCFLVGTRSVRYENPLPKEQAELVDWEVSQIEAVLDEQPSRRQRLTWTTCWLNVLKSFAAKGFNPAMPRFGFGDPKSYSITECAVSRLSTCGAVRHGAECFNYFFPQELDEEFLIVSDTLPGVPWKYVGVSELQEFLCEKIDEGFTFPLNPKWVLCDKGWKEVYNRLMSSEKANVQDSLDIWYPRESGIRERIESIHERHPQGFIQGKRYVRMSGTEAMDLATLELDRFLAFRRAKMKLRAVVAFNDLLVSVRRKRAEDIGSPSLVENGDGKLVEDTGSSSFVEGDGVVVKDTGSCPVNEGNGTVGQHRFRSC